MRPAPAAQPCGCEPEVPCAIPHFPAEPLDTLECYRLEGGVYQLVLSGRAHERVASPDFPGLTIPLADLWLTLDERAE